MFLATTDITTDVLRAVAGEGKQVRGLLKQGQDPHAYVPSSRDMALIDQADLLFTNGFGLEESFLPLLEAVPTLSVVELSTKVEPIKGEESHGYYEDHEDLEVDPHTWMSPLNVILWVDVIVEALQKADPTEGDGYRQRGEAYQKELRILHNNMVDVFALLPPQRRSFVADHNVFAYFARDYGFEVLGSLFNNFSVSAEVSIFGMKKLIDTIKERQVPAILISINAPESVQNFGAVIASEIDHPIMVQTVLTSSLASQGQWGTNYLDFMAYNSVRIFEALEEDS